MTKPRRESGTPIPSPKVVVFVAPVHHGPHWSPQQVLLKCHLLGPTLSKGDMECLWVLPALIDWKEEARLAYGLQRKLAQPLELCPPPNSHPLSQEGVSPKLHYGLSERAVLTWANREKGKEKHSSLGLFGCLAEREGSPRCLGWGWTTRVRTSAKVRLELGCPLRTRDMDPWLWL